MFLFSYLALKQPPIQYLSSILRLGEAKLTEENVRIRFCTFAVPLCCNAVIDFDIEYILPTV